MLAGLSLTMSHTSAHAHHMHAAMVQQYELILSNLLRSNARKYTSHLSPQYMQYIQ